MAEEVQQQPGRFVTPPFPTGAGMDFDSPSFLLGTKRWRYAFNVRNVGRIVSVPQKYQAHVLNNPVWFLGSISTGTSSIWLAVIGEKLYLFYPSPMTFIELGTISVTSNRLSSFAFNDLLFFVGESTDAFSTDGRRIVSIFSGRKTALSTTEDGQMFTKQDRFDSFGNDIGRLPGVFKWELGTVYRVYCDNPSVLKQDWEVELDFYNLSLSAAPRGLVVGVGREFVFVSALNTVENVENSPEVAGLVRVIRAPTPRGRYVAVFFDHLVIGAVSGAENRIIWSGLRDFAEWEPGSGTEADGYTFTEHQPTDSIISGITGMSVVGDELVVLTSNAVYGVRYVGLPTKMQVYVKAVGIGCTFYFGSIFVNGSLYWPDAVRGGFFRLSSQGVERISFGIENFFFKDIAIDAKSVRELFAYHDALNNEIVWTYPTYDGKRRAIVFDYKHNEWTVRQGEGLTAYALFMLCSKPISNISGTVQSLTGTFGELGNVPLAANQYWGTKSSGLVVNAPNDPDPNRLLPYEEAVVETGDFVVSNLQTVKEFDAIAMSASDDVKVYVAAAQNVDSATAFKYVGTWKPMNFLGNLLPFEGGAVSGNSLTFRFVIPKPKTTLSLIETNAFDLSAQY